MNYLKTPWTSQPQQAVGIDWSNPITRGLVNATAPSVGRDSVSDALITFSNAELGAGLAGVGFSQTSSASSSLGIPNTPLDLNELTVVYVFSCNRRAGYASWLVSQSTSFGLVSGLNNYLAEWKIPGQAWNTRTSVFLGNFPTSVNSGVHIVVAKWSASENSGFGRLWFDGVELANSSSTPQTVPSNQKTHDSANTKIGSDENAGTKIFLFGKYSRSLSDAEIRSISQNPWQIFKPLPRRIFVPVAAATGDATGTGSFYDVTLSSPTGTATGTGASNGTGTGALAASSLSSPSATATGSALATGSLPAVSTTAPSATATGSALATGALTTVTLTTITASATGSALAMGSLDAIDLSTVSGTATGTTAGNATGVGAVATIALSAPSASAVGSALATGGFAHVSLSAVSGTASAATNGQATADLQPISISAPLAIAIASSVATGGIQSIGLTAPNASATGQAQTIARPGSDTSNSGWTPSTGSDLYAMLDEVTPNDADYISTASAGSVCRLGLGAVADPGTSSGQVVSYRASSSTGNGLKVELMQGGTVIATWNHATLPATDTTYQQSLSAAECDAITDYTALSVRLTSL